MDLGINGKVALVMGAGGGLGSAICLALAREGVRVVAADVSAVALEATLRALRDAGATAVGAQMDVGNVAGMAKHLDAIRADAGPIDILVNNSGGPPPSPAAGVAPDVWRAHFESMVLGLIHLSDTVLPGMRERGWGRIITSTSSGVLSPIPNLGISNTLRSALVGWSKTLAAEVARDGVTVNVVVPGRVATDRIKALDAARAQREGRTIEEVERDSTRSIPVGRYGRPDEYANAVTFLAGAGASYITGSIVRVDGGLIPGI